jgi:bifunctional non-homologous end joining protein LigD
MGAAPMGAPHPRGQQGQGRPSFVVQEHHARALHWDFRLEHDGVLVSWALPKGVPEDPAANHLAVHTEDHPLEYGSFEGDIGKGQYGGGHVSIWDHGEYELEKWTEREVMVVLHGSRAQGRYVLFATGGKNWMIHRMDPPRAGFEPLPGLVRPMLAVAGVLPASDDGWAYEIKWDGVRAIVYVSGGRVRALSRNDKDITGSFPELREAGEKLGARPAILDGELVALDLDGRPSFGRLQQRLHLSGGSLLTGDSFRDAAGSDVLSGASQLGLEGIVAKRRDAPYRPGQRSEAWVKVKEDKTQEVVIGGWTEGKGEREGSLGALLLGIPDSAGLRYAGKVGTGFGERERRDLLRILRPLASKTSPFSAPLSQAETALAHFVRPAIVGEVRHGGWTSDGRLRHPSWRGPRPDKDPAEVILEP